MVREAFVEPSWVALKKSPMRSILGVGLIFRRRTLSLIQLSVSVSVIQLIGLKFSTFDLYDDVIFWLTLGCNEYIPRHQKLTPLWG